MITLEVHDDLVPAAQRLTPEHYRRVAVAVNARLPQAPDGVMSVSYVTDAEIRRLNRMYRGKDKVTDVLSFGSGMPETGELGDIIISFDQAVRQSEGGDIELECVDLVVHGILHNLGYDHERPEDADAMFPLQDAIVAQVL